MTEKELIRFALQLREARRVAAEIARDESGLPVGLPDGVEGPPGDLALLEREPALAAAA